MKLAGSASGRSSPTMLPTRGSLRQASKFEAPVALPVELSSTPMRLSRTVSALAVPRLWHGLDPAHRRPLLSGVALGLPRWHGP
jgi:hypothetical protein